MALRVICRIPARSFYACRLRCSPHVQRSSAITPFGNRPACRQFVSFSYQSHQASGGGASGGRGKPSHYVTLGIPSSASPKEIRSGYLQKAKTCHPDLHGDTKNAEFQQLTHAYSVLSDSAKRGQYDAFGFRDFEDLSDKDQAEYMFRQNLRGIWTRRSWGSIVRGAVPVYAVVYVVAHGVVFVIDIPANMLMGAFRLCGSMLGM